jgi:hypothetical protein
MRYAEEVELLFEEMRRVLAFLEWDRDRWKKRALNFPQRDSDNAAGPSTPSASLVQKAVLEEGLRAYALHQASVHQHLFDTFGQQWHDIPAFIEITNQGLADDERGGEGDSIR